MCKSNCNPLARWTTTDAVSFLVYRRYLRFSSSSSANFNEIVDNLDWYRSARYSCYQNTQIFSIKRGDLLREPSAQGCQLRRKAVRACGIDQCGSTKSHLLPYKSSKTTTVPYSSSRGSSQKRTPQER